MREHAIMEYMISVWPLLDLHNVNQLLLGDSNSMPGVVTVLPVPGENKYGNLALHVGGVSNFRQ
jgi:hypothetical protein